MSQVDPSPRDSAGDPMVPVAYRVAETKRETVDTFTLDLRVADGSAPMRFAPGQFNMIYAFGVGESAISISGDPEDGERIFHTIREVGIVTSALDSWNRSMKRHYATSSICVRFRTNGRRPWTLSSRAG